MVKSEESQQEVTKLQSIKMHILVLIVGFSSVAIMLLGRSLFILMP